MRFAAPLALSAVLFFFFVASASSDEQQHDDPLRGAFAQWMRTHAKSYSNEEFVFRWNAWRENHRFIEEHNRQNHSYHLAMNQFGDLTADEFQTLYTPNLGRGPLTADDNSTATPPILKEKATFALACVDWRQTTPRVKNQGQCGSDYAFSALGALEGMLSRKYGRQGFDLSEQNIVDCSGPQGNYGCNGGFMTACYEYVKKSGGVNYAVNYPYTGQQGQCRFNPNSKVGLSSYAVIPYGSEQALEQALATVGPVAVAVDASLPSFRFYSAGIYVEPSATPTNLATLWLPLVTARRMAWRTTSSRTRGALVGAKGAT